MSDYNLTVGIDLTDRVLKANIPDNTVISEFKYIAKADDSNYIAEKNVDGVSIGYVHRIYYGSEIEEVFYSSDGTNENEIVIGV